MLIPILQIKNLGSVTGNTFPNVSHLVDGRAKFRPNFLTTKLKIFFFPFIIPFLTFSLCF